MIPPLQHALRIIGPDGVIGREFHRWLQNLVNTYDAAADLYVLLAGRAGGQTIIGGTANADGLNLQPSSGAVPTGKLSISNLGAGTSTTIEVGDRATGNRFSAIDLHGDDTNTDYGLRIIRSSGGVNSPSRLQHRGTGALDLRTDNGGSITLTPNATTRVTVDAAGVVTMTQEVNADAFTGAQAPSSFTIPTGQFCMVPDIALTGTSQLTVAGTGYLKVIN